MRAKAGCTSMPSVAHHPFMGRCEALATASPRVMVCPAGAYTPCHVAQVRDCRCTMSTRCMMAEHATGGWFVPQMHLGRPQMGAAPHADLSLTGIAHAGRRPSCTQKVSACRMMIPTCWLYLVRLPPTWSCELVGHAGTQGVALRQAPEHPHPPAWDVCCSQGQFQRPLDHGQVTSTECSAFCQQGAYAYTICLQSNRL